MGDITSIYEGANLSGATSGITFTPIVRDGTLTEIEIAHRRGVTQVGAAVFEVRKNNVVIAGLAAVTVADSAENVEISGLNIALADGDEIKLNLLSGNVQTPITFNLAVDDGESSGGESLPAGDLNASTNKLEKLQGIEVAVAPTLTSLSDNFSGTEIDFTNKWQLFNAGASGLSIALASGKLRTTSSGGSAGAYGLQTKTAKDFTGKFVFVKIGTNLTQNTSASGDYFVVFGGSGACYFQIINNSISAVSQDGNGTIVSASISFPSNSTIYLRFRYDGTTLFSDYSNNGTSWTNMKMTVPHPTFDLTAAQFRLQTNGGSAASTCDWDDFTTDLTTGTLESIPDKALFSYDAPNNNFKLLSLADLKAALDALP